MTYLATDSFSVIAPRITGCISAVSSSLIIYTISRSAKKLGTIYHRLMFAMSGADILGSVAMALTTLPLPKDYTPSSDWPGSRLGNIQTCEAQGFFVTFGTSTMFAYNAMLCVYYACAIAFKMNEHKIVRRVEPFLHAFPLAFGLGSALAPLFMQMYNPSNHQAWCTVTENESLGRGIGLKQRALMVMILIYISIMIIIVTTCFALIIWRVYHTEKLLASVLILGSGRRIIRTSQLISVTSRLDESHKNTKVVIIQAFAYLGSFLLTLLFYILRATFTALQEGPLTAKVIARLYVIFTPLQGFFNTLIFISHKIYNYRRAHEEVSRWETFKMLLRGSLDEPILFSRISQLEVHAGQEYIDVELADEENVEHITVHLNIEDDEIPRSPSNGGLENFDDNEIQKIESHDLSGFDVSTIQHQPSGEHNRSTVRQSLFPEQSNIPEEDSNSKNVSASSPAGHESSNMNVSHAGLSGFSSSAPNDSNISYDSRDLSGLSTSIQRSQGENQGKGSNASSGFSRGAFSGMFRFGSSEKSSLNSDAISEDDEE